MVGFAFAVQVSVHTTMVDKYLGRKAAGVLDIRIAFDFISAGTRIVLYTRTRSQMGSWRHSRVFLALEGIYARHGSRDRVS